MATHIPEMIDGLPAISGFEDLAGPTAGAIFLSESRIRFAEIQSAFALALHMHQPMIPAGGGDLRSAALISNLKHMMDNQHIHDNHNAPIFLWCYKRMGEFIPRLVSEGKDPRIMLDYSGCLLYGLRLMGAHDVLEALAKITCEPEYRRCVEWLGCSWGHAVAPSTPPQDYRLHVLAWRQHFASIFGLDALRRVRGFSPAEMALPNHPDVAYEFVRTIKECGYWWILVQEHTVEQPDNGWHPQRPHLPHRLVARNSRGESASIIAIIKTQGSDNKLVAQMQPMYEARGLLRQNLGGKSIPPLVTQIGDGENGGVMMNEFPAAYLRGMAEASGSKTPAMNATEYLEHLFAAGVREEDLPVVQPVQQKRIWERFSPGAGPEALEKAIAQLRQEDNRFHMEGGSWTNNISWVKGYENVLQPMQEASALFARKCLAGGVKSSEHRYRNALYHLLLSQTSCYRYWGQGTWTDYGREICRRAKEILEKDFP